MARSLTTVGKVSKARGRQTSKSKRGAPKAARRRTSRAKPAAVAIENTRLRRKLRGRDVRCREAVLMITTNSDGRRRERAHCLLHAALDLLGGVDTYRIHKTIAARVTTAW